MGDPLIGLWLLGCVWITDADIDARLQGTGGSDPDPPEDSGGVPILVQPTNDCSESHCYVDVGVGDGVVCAASGAGRTDCWTDSGTLALGVELATVDVDGRVVCGNDRFSARPYCWELRDGAAFQGGPLEAPELTSQSDVLVGDGWACSYTLDGLTCWGAPPFDPSDVELASVDEISGGDDLICMSEIDSTFQARCLGTGDWAPGVVMVGLRDVDPGSASYGVVGTSEQGELQRWRGGDFTPVETRDGRFVQASASGDHACGIQDDSVLGCIGDGSLGQGDQDAPTQPWAQVEAGRGFTCGLTVDGALYCWGGGLPDGYANP